MQNTDGRGVRGLKKKSYEFVDKGLKPSCEFLAGTWSLNENVCQATY